MRDIEDGAHCFAHTTANKCVFVLRCAFYPVGETGHVKGIIKGRLSVLTGERSLVWGNDLAKSVNLALKNYSRLAVLTVK